MRNQTCNNNDYFYETQLIFNFTESRCLVFDNNILTTLFCCFSISVVTFLEISLCLYNVAFQDTSGTIENKFSTIEHT